MTNRFPELAEDELTDEQRDVVRALVNGPRGVVQGPFIPLLRNPGLASRVEKLGEYLRFGGVLPKRLTELVILVVSEAWRAPFEWQIHAPLARMQGISLSAIKCVGEGRRPDNADPEVLAVYDFVSSLLEKKMVPESVYLRVLHVIGEPGVIELVGVCGYYTMLAMVLNVADFKAEDDANVPFPPPDPDGDLLTDL